MGHASHVRSRARKRAGRRCAPSPARAPAQALDLTPEVEDYDPLLETPDIFEPELEFELAPEPAPEPHREPSPLARALAVAVGVEEACEANDNAETEFVAPTQPEPVARVSKPAPPPQQTTECEEEEPPFDAPDADDDIFRPPTHARRWSDPADVLDLHMLAPPSFPHEPTDIRPPPRPAPAISIHVSWDRAAGAALAETLAADPLLARADISDTRGGVGGAAAHLAKLNPPDLLILESTLKSGALLEAIDALQASLSPATKIFIVGDVNDVTLLRDLARRGIMHYFLVAAGAEDIVRAICDLYADVDRSRVIAIVGSRGGAGASTIAHNLAWSFAERYDASTTLIELDIAFGTTAFSFDQRPSHSVAEGVHDPQLINEAFLDRVGVMQTERLRLIAAPSALGEDLALERAAVGALIRNARRMSKVVVLDVPHVWDACIKDVLERANDVVIVAPPDLASLRNAKSLFDVLKPLRPTNHEAMVALSMVGASKASEISEKDFTGAVGAKPILAFEFDPALFAGSALKRQMIGEAAPQSAAARQIDDLAALITGRKLVKRRKSARKAQAELARMDARRATAMVEATPVAQTPASAQSVVDLTEALPEIIVQTVEPARPERAPAVAAAPRRVRPRPVAHNKPRPKHPPQPGTLRLAFALMALMATSMWYVEKRADVDIIGYAISAGR
jgi:pilus assembly protein CpaE